LRRRRRRRRGWSVPLDVSRSFGSHSVQFREGRKLRFWKWLAGRESDRDRDAKDVAVAASKNRHTPRQWQR
jgi:hypothetical protein